MRTYKLVKDLILPEPCSPQPCTPTNNITYAKKGQLLMGTIVQGGLIRVNQSLMTPANWGTSGTLRFANPTPPKCDYWVWQDDDPSAGKFVSDNVGNFSRNGTCYLLTTSATYT